MNKQRFADRKEAGRALAEELREFAGRDDVIIYALPRGGVPVAFEVACALDVPLDVMVVRKLGVPGREELALGAVASGGVMVRSDEVISGLGIGDDVIEQIARREREELRARESRFRTDRTPPDPSGKTVIVIDDGIATGSTMRAALGALRQLGPSRIVMAVPVAAPEVCENMRKLADDVRCLLTPNMLMSVGSWYQSFPQTDDDEVRRLLDEAAASHAGA